MSRAGGQYKVDKSGKKRLVKKPTQDHRLGNRARGKDEEDQPTRVVEQPAKRGGK